MMTKEVLKSELKHNHENSLTEILDKFFEQNVVIPKGENRHPYADVLHNWIEGAIVEEFASNSWNYFMPAHLVFSREYRIKPQAPTYEWQWVYHKKFMEQTIRTKYMTDAEFIKLCEENDMSGFSKQEKTRRLRVC